MPGYIIPEVRADIIADVAKTLANSSRPLTLNELAKSYEKEYSAEYIRRAAVACTQLKLAITSETGSYACKESERDDLKKSLRSELFAPFAKRLQDFAPFLLYADLVSKEYSSLEAATRIRGILDIDGIPDKIERSLRGWGKFGRLIDESKGKITICIDTEKFVVGYVKKLMEALEAEISAKIFTIDMLGPEVFAFLDAQGISLTEIAQALRNYEVDPKHSAGRSTEVFEAFMHSMIKTKAIQIQKPRSTLMDWVEGLRSNKEIPANLLLTCQGLVGIRNMTHHNPDSETGIPWGISKQAALTTTLLVPITIRGVYLYSMQRKQEF